MTTTENLADQNHQLLQVAERLYAALLSLPDGLPQRGSVPWADNDVQQMTALAAVRSTEAVAMASLAWHGLRDIRRVIEREYDETQLGQGDTRVARDFERSMRAAQEESLMAWYGPAKEAAMKALDVLIQMPEERPKTTLSPLGWVARWSSILLTAAGRRREA
jgi:hypothetical protein